MLLVMKEKKERKPTIADLLAAISRLEEKVEACYDLCEQILDEVTPLWLEIDAIAEDAASTAD